MVVELSSDDEKHAVFIRDDRCVALAVSIDGRQLPETAANHPPNTPNTRSEEHTSELQSDVCSSDLVLGVFGGWLLATTLLEAQFGRWLLSVTNGYSKVRRWSVVVEHRHSP